MKIFLGSDHGGFSDKTALFSYLLKAGYEAEDVGAKKLDPTDDYPQFAYQAVQTILGSTDPDPRAILLCRGGQGMAIAANRHSGIRAAVVWSESQARKCRLDNDTNILCLPADELEPSQISDIVDIWLNTDFTHAPRHVRRLQEIDSFYKG